MKAIVYIFTPFQPHQTIQGIETQFVTHLYIVMREILGSLAIFFHQNFQQEKTKSLCVDQGNLIQWVQAKHTR